MHKGYELEYASEGLKADKKFIMEVDKRRSYAIEFVSEELKTDKKFMTEAVMHRGDGL